MVIGDGTQTRVVDVVGRRSNERVVRALSWCSLPRGHQSALSNVDVVGGVGETPSRHLQSASCVPIDACDSYAIVQRVENIAVYGVVGDSAVVDKDARRGQIKGLA